MLNEFDVIFDENLDSGNDPNVAALTMRTPGDSMERVSIFLFFVNEINKINLNNSSELLQVFLNKILKYNDSVRLFIQQSERKNTT